MCVNHLWLVNLSLAESGSSSSPSLGGLASRRSHQSGLFSFCGAEGSDRTDQAPLALHPSWASFPRAATWPPPALSSPPSRGSRRHPHASSKDLRCISAESFLSGWIGSSLSKSLWPAGGTVM